MKCEQKPQQTDEHNKGHEPPRYVVAVVADVHRRLVKAVLPHRRGDPGEAERNHGHKQREIEIVLQELWKDLKLQVDALAGGIDFVVFTGDVAWHGKKEEYDWAAEHFFRPLLDQVGLSADRLFVVPGNHDLDLDVVDAIASKGVASLKTRAEVDRLLESDGTRRALLSPLSSYTDFLGTLYGSCPTHKALDQPAFFYNEMLELGDQIVSMVGLNSAIFSGRNRDIDGEIDDYGKLWLGDYQLSEALRRVPEGSLCIVIMHHPFAWLNDSDAQDAEPQISKTADFVLHGHWHRPHFKRELTSRGSTITIPTGSVFNESKWLNGYTLVRLSPDAQRLNVVLRRWDGTNREWHKDIQSTGEVEDGVIELPWRISTVTPLSVPADEDTALSSPLPEPLPSPEFPRPYVSPAWLEVGRRQEIRTFEEFVDQSTVNSLWLYGSKGCGSNEFLQIARACLGHKGVHVLYFDTADTSYGIPADQRFFLSQLEVWAAEESHEDVSKRESLFVSERLQLLVEDLRRLLENSNRRLALVVANVHLMHAADRAWVCRYLWDEALGRLPKDRMLAVFSCEGDPPSCPASSQETKLHLGEFTKRDVSQFLASLPDAGTESLQAVAQRVHSGDSERFSVEPRAVYMRLLLEIATRA